MPLIQSRRKIRHVPRGGRKAEGGREKKNKRDWKRTAIKLINPLNSIEAETPGKREKEIEGRLSTLYSVHSALVGGKKGGGKGEKRRGGRFLFFALSIFPRAMGKGKREKERGEKKKERGKKEGFLRYLSLPRHPSGKKKTEGGEEGKKKRSSSTRSALSYLRHQDLRGEEENCKGRKGGEGGGRIILNPARLRRRRRREKRKKEGVGLKRNSRLYPFLT